MVRAARVSAPDHCVRRAIESPVLVLVGRSDASKKRGCAPVFSASRSWQSLCSASMACTGVQSLTTLTSPRCMAFGNAAQLPGSRPDCANNTASSGRPPAARSKVRACPSAMPCVCNQAIAAPVSGQTMACPRQRLRMVGKSWCAASLARTNLTSPGGSSSVLSSALAVTLFMRSAGKISTALPRPRALVRWVNSTASRMASTRISLLGLRFLSSMSVWAFSLNGQPSASMTVSGINTHRSACVRTSMAWQLPH